MINTGNSAIKTIADYVRGLPNKMILYDDQGEIIAISDSLSNLDWLGFFVKNQLKMEDVLKNISMLNRLNQLEQSKRIWVKFKNEVDVYCGHSKFYCDSNRYHTVEFFGSASVVEYRQNQSKLSQCDENFEIGNCEQIIENTLDHINSNIYISDVDTFDLVFVNKMMRETFNIGDYSGKKCYEVFQQDMKGPCNFCPIHSIRVRKNASSVIWEESNSTTGQCYLNCDSIMKWVDGRTVHLQDSRDITNEKVLNAFASKDDLTGALNRRVGYLRLKEQLDMAACFKKKVSLCYIDINDLKTVNDKYGHREGDTLITTISDQIDNHIRDNDVFCRVGGDEFFIGFFDVDKEKCEHVMKRISNELKEVKVKQNLPYEVSISYGIVTVDPRNGIHLYNFISQADKLMYEHKKKLKSERVE